jgi:ribonuclease BN (tRNA processing enzyme)
MAEVEIQFLGSGDAMGSGGRFQACILVRSGEGSFLIDCGASSLVAMKRFGVDPSSIDRIVISHLHGDHFGGIPFLILDGQFARRTLPLIIAGPEGVEDRVKTAMEVFFPGSSRVERKFPVSFIELHHGKESGLGSLSIVAYEGVHPSGSPSLSLRMEVAGRVIAYSGDTEWTETLIEAARNAHLFISEAYSFEKKIKYHLDYRTILEQVSRLGCRKIILTHMSQNMLSRLGEVKVDWAEDGKKIPL